MILAYLLILHFIADFLLQSREMGKNKSSNNTYLFKHISIIFFVILIGLIPFLGLKLAFVVAFYNALIHAIIDKFIWNAYKLYAYKQIMKAIRQEYRDTFGENTCQDDKSLEVTASESYQKRIRNWQYWEDHWFYTTIGLDQLLHALTLTVLVGLLL